jgi:hypothetical protein
MLLSSGGHARGTTRFLESRTGRPAKPSTPPPPGFDRWHGGHRPESSRLRLIAVLAALGPERQFGISGAA